MNMKKILLAGIAVGALASTGANAITLTAATVSGTALTLANGIVTAPYGLVGNLTGVSPAAQLATTTGSNGNFYQITVNTSTGVVPVSSLVYEVSFKLTGTGNPTFIAPTAGTGAGGLNRNNLTLFGVSASTVTTIAGSTTAAITFGTCNINNLTLNSGGVNQAALTYRFDVTGICNASNGLQSIRLDAPFQVAAVGTVVLASDITTPLLGNNSIDAIGGSTQTLVTTVGTYSDVGIGPNPFGASTYASFNTGQQVPTAWAAAGAAGFNPFTSYTTAAGTDLVIGSIKASYLSPTSQGVLSINSNMAGGGLPALTASVAVTATTSPVFNAMRPGLASQAGASSGTVAIAAASVNSSNTVATIPVAAFAATSSAAALASNIIVGAVANNNVSVTTPQAYSAVLNVATSTASGVPAFAPVSSNLETTTVQGFRIDAPWFGGSRASTPSLVRLSNSSSVATGTVTLVLNNAVLASGESLTASTCQIATGVPATAELLIDTSRVTTCFGNFVRGDLAITVQGAVANLTAKMRVLSSNGSVSEQTLGNVSASTAVVN
jgi:hypothetical protein